MRQLHGAGAAGFGHGNNGVDLAGRQERDQSLGQRFAHLQARAVHRNTINGGVGPGQIDVFKQAGIECGGVSALLRAHAPLQIHKHRFAGGDIAVKRNAQPFERDGFAGQHDRAVFAVPHAQRANAVGIAKSQQAVSGNHGDYGIRAFDALVHGAHGAENVGFFQPLAVAGAPQFVRQYVEQHFRVAFGVDVAVVGMRQLHAQSLGVGEVAVMYQHDAERRIHVKRLCFFFVVGRACRRVAHLPQAAVAGQGAHVAGAENIAHHALVLVHEKLAVFLGGDACRILPAVLQQQQGIVKQLVHMVGMHHGDNSTHADLPF